MVCIACAVEDGNNSWRARKGEDDTDAHNRQDMKALDYLHADVEIARSYCVLAVAESETLTPGEQDKSDVMRHQQQWNPESRNPVGRSHSHWRIINRRKGDRCEQVESSENIENPHRRPGQATAAQHERDCCERKDGSYQIAKCSRIRKLRRHSRKSGAAS